MKKAFCFALLMLVLASAMSSAAIFKRNKKSKNALRYSDLRVTFVTTQGNASFYLYPEAAPETVASFLNLAKRGYYNNNKIHRAIENFVVQAGDPTGTGRGGPGYMIKDEIVDWLDFFQQGMLAMANAGPGTGGSQYFMTVYPAEWLNGKHTVFGEYIDDSDFDVIRKLEFGDVIKEIRFQGNVDAYLSLHKDKIDQWNAALDKEYPDLKKYPVKSAAPSALAAYQKELETIYSKKQKEKSDKQYFIPRTIRKIESKFTGEKKEKETTVDNSDVGEFKADLEQMEEELKNMKTGATTN
ncbi:peptidylprolyl isomerase [Fusobacterium sp. PH5-44]|uniref:peptidylprolyl isomerase n=1 Tax=unclassified Fusobacterium TaxID=2648384 RepID=UPI003D19E000